MDEEEVKRLAALFADTVREAIHTRLPVFTKAMEEAGMAPDFHAHVAMLFASAAIAAAAHQDEETFARGARMIFQLASGAYRDFLKQTGS